MENNQPESAQNSEIRKQNQDLPNMPASSSKINSEEEAKKQISQTSHLQESGKTDNTEENQGKK